MRFTSHTKKVKLILPLLTLVIVATLVAVKADSTSRKPVCYLEFEDQSEYVESLASWIMDYYKKNPQATIEEIEKARMDYLLESGCVDKSSEDSLGANT